MSAGFCLGAGSYQWPVIGNVLVAFKADGHRGVDIAASVGAEIVSAQDGVVVWVGKTARGEGCITIEHSDGISSTYLPVEASVNKGETVTAGDRIGKLSSEGDPSCAASHLHLGIYDTSTRSDKEYLDPKAILPPPGGPVPTENSNAAESVNPNCAVGSSQNLNAIDGDSMQGSSSAQPITGLANKNSVETEELVSQNTNTGNEAIIIESYQGKVLQVDLSAITPAGSPETTAETVNKGAVVSNNTLQKSISADAVGVKQICITGNQGASIVCDSTYHEAKDSSLKNKENVTIKPSHIESDASGRVGYGSSKDEYVLTGTINNFANAMSSSSTWKQLTPEQKEKLIKAVNPFVGKYAHAAQTSKANTIANNGFASGGAPKTSSQKQLAISKLIRSILEAEGLPDVMAIMALAGIIILSVGGFYKNMHTMKKILPTSSIVSC
jgi:hypothetical protein